MASDLPFEYKPRQAELIPLLVRAVLEQDDAAVHAITARLEQRDRDLEDFLRGLGSAAPEPGALLTWDDWTFRGVAHRVDGENGAAVLVGNDFFVGGAIWYNDLVPSANLHMAVRSSVTGGGYGWSFIMSNEGIQDGDSYFGIGFSGIQGLGVGFTVDGASPVLRIMGPAAHGDPVNILAQSYVSEWRDGAQTDLDVQVTGPNITVSVNGTAIFTNFNYSAAVTLNTNINIGFGAVNEYPHGGYILDNLSGNF